MTFDWVNLLAYIAYSLILVSLSIVAIRLYVKNTKLSAEVMQLLADKLLLIQKIGELSAADDSLVIEQTEGFVRFLTDSRQWAFDYIETVQEASDNFQEVLDRMVFEDFLGPEQIEELRIAYQKFATAMPSNDVTNEL